MNYDLEKNTAYALIYVLINFVGLLVFPLYLFNIVPSNSIVMFINFIILFILGIVLFRKSIGESIAELRGNYFRLFRNIVLGMVFSIGLSNLLNTFAQIKETANQNIVNEAIYSLPILSFFSVVIMGPMVEELIFRKLLIGELSKKIPTPIAVIISILLFSFVHTWFSIEILIYIPIALAITFIYFKMGKNFMASYIYHVMWNLLSFTISMNFIE